MDSDLSVLKVESSHLHYIIIVVLFINSFFKINVLDVDCLYFGVPCPAVCLDVFINVRNVLV